MANRSIVKSQKLKTTIDGDRIVQEKERQLGQKTMEYLEIRNKLEKIKLERTREAWLLKKEIENLEKDKQALEQKSQSLEMKNKELRKKHQGNSLLH